MKPPTRERTIVAPYQRHSADSDQMYGVQPTRADVEGGGGELVHPGDACFSMGDPRAFQHNAAAVRAPPTATFDPYGAPWEYPSTPPSRPPQHFSRDSLRYARSAAGSSSESTDAQSPYSNPSSLPTPQSLYVPLEAAWPESSTHAYYVEQVSSPSSMSPQSRVSQPSPHYRTPPSPYPSPSARLAPALSGLSIDPSRGASSPPVSPQNAYPSPRGSTHSHDGLSFSHYPYTNGVTDGAHRLSRDGKQMMPGTPTHPDIPRPMNVAPPVPVPNLTKKSRGRQVPSISPTSSKSANGASPPLSLAQPPIAGYPYFSTASSSLSGWGGEDYTQRKTPQPPISSPLVGMDMDTALASSSAMSAVENKSRPYVCTVEGCGKAYIRAEHLKRHVRSIHTNDKPYECPAPDCGREFSRYDNLCQHFKGVHGPTSTLRNPPR